MSDNCINCVKNKRTGPDLLCDECRAESSLAAPTGLDDALGILINISKEYQRFCDVMLTMPERKSELKAGSQFMDSLENLRDELLKRKSSNSSSTDKMP